MYRTVVFILCALISTMNAKQGDVPESWTVSKHNGEMATFQCNDNKTNSQAFFPSSSYGQWVLPNGQILGRNTAKSHWNVSKNGYEIIISNIQEETFGWYKCVALNATGHLQSIAIYGLNLAGPIYTEGWKKYENGAIYGGIAAAIVLVFSVGLCVVYKFRYKDQEYYEERKRYREEYANGVANKGMEDSSISASYSVEDASANIKTIS